MGAGKCYWEVIFASVAASLGGVFGNVAYAIVLQRAAQMKVGRPMPTDALTVGF